MHLFGCRHICSHSPSYQQFKFSIPFPLEDMSAILQTSLQVVEVLVGNILLIFMVQGWPCTFTSAQQKALHSPHLKFIKHSKREIQVLMEHIV
jgi:hypothetical protein